MASARSSFILDDDLAGLARRLHIDISAAAREGVAAAVRSSSAKSDREAYERFPEQPDRSSDSAEAWGDERSDPSTESRSVWPSSIFTDRLGLEIPLLQALMAGAATPALAAAVSRAGGLGGLGLGAGSPRDAGSLIQAARALGATRINANVFLHAKPIRDEALERLALEALKPLADRVGASDPPSLREPFGTFGAEMLEVLVDQQPEVVTFHFAAPGTEVVERLHSVGSLIGGTATTVSEAQALARSGCDFVIAQGTEAGGHRGTFIPSVDESRIGTFSLLPQVVDAVDIPVVAAGGIADGRGFAAALLLGASAVQVGTAFLCTAEAAITPGHRSALENRSAEDVTVSYAFSGRPARAFRNDLTETLIHSLRPLQAFRCSSSLQPRCDLPRDRVTKLRRCGPGRASR